MLRAVRRVSSALIYGLLLIACRDPRTSARPRSGPSLPPQSVAPTPAAAPKPRVIAGALPVAPFVAEQLLQAQGSRTVVYVGAGWCEPCQRFHRALSAGELDAVMQGVRFVEYDFDVAGRALEADGYGSQYLPFFALPRADGHCGPRSMQGSIKGEAAVTGNIVPRLQELLSAR
jgi:hypothetical protein